MNIYNIKEKISCVLNIDKDIGLNYVEATSPCYLHMKKQFR